MITIPIHSSFKSLAKGMASQYKGGKQTCRPFTDDTKVCASAKAWQVFYSYLNKRGWKDTEPMPRKMTLEDMLELASEFIADNRNLW